jgi:hypothetical protein
LTYDEVDIELSEDDKRGTFKQLGGSDSDNFNTVLAEQAFGAVYTPVLTNDAAQCRQYKAVVAALQGAAPRDELEGMLAGQLVGMHNAAMEFLRRALNPEIHPDVRRDFMNLATKASRTYEMLMKTLDRRRGSGNQHIRVEHVTVNEGGQAIVGVINRAEHHPAEAHAEPAAPRSIEYRAEEPMRCANPQWEPVPVAASNGKKAL